MGMGTVWCGDVAALSPEIEHWSRSVRRGGSVKKKSGADLEEATTSQVCKRVMVVVDESRESKLALQWALSHVVHQLDVLTLLHVQPVPPSSRAYSPHGNFFNANVRAIEEARRKNEVEGWELANSFKTLCATCRPDVEVEILVLEGEKGPTIVGQAKKLEASVLVIGQRKPAVFWRLLKRKNGSLAEYCIQNSDCLTLAVRKKNRRLGGYLINSQWQKNFWLLA